MSAFPSTIQAITITAQGDVDVIKKQAVPFPDVPPQNIVIKVHFAGVNFIDVYQRSGLYPVSNFPAKVGMEAAGEIVKLPTDEAVLNDEEFKKNSLKIGGKAATIQLGSFAEYVSVPWKEVIPVSDAVSTTTAAAATLQGLTALTFMTEAYNVKKGDTVFVSTVAGGVGLVAAQIAKARGATVIGTTSSEKKALLAKEHGADHVILYKTENTVDRVLEITGGKGVDAVFDGVGKDTFEDDFKFLKRKGTLVSLGNASGAVPPMAPAKLRDKNLKLVRPMLNNYIVEPEEVRFYSAELSRLIETGAVKINIFKEYPFTAEGVKEAQLALVGGQTTGKLVIKIAPE